MKTWGLSSIALGVTLLAGAGCSSSSSPSSGGGGDGGSSMLAPPAQGQGIQLSFETTIAASTEDERCKFVQTTDDMWVNSEDIRYTPGSHHFILWQTSYPSIPTVDSTGATVDTSGVFDCIDGPQVKWSVNGPIGGAQAPDAPPVLGNLPSDVALHIPAGSVLVMDLHVLNASPKPLDTTVLINLNTVPKSQVQQEAGMYFFYNPFIRVPAGGSSAARMSCPVTGNVTLANGQTHMHKQGVSASVRLNDASGNMLQAMYASQQWTDPPVTEWSPGMALQAGQQIDFECHYQNPGTTDVIQGLSAATNEMCVFLGAYYPRDPKFEDCSATGGWATLGSAATFIGSGTANGSTTYQCWTSADPSSPNYRDTLDGCVVDSCPAIAQPLTAAIRCVMQAGQANAKTACMPQLSSLQQATCN